MVKHLIVFILVFSSLKVYSQVDNINENPDNIEEVLGCVLTAKDSLSVLEKYLDSAILESNMENSNKYLNRVLLFFDYISDKGDNALFIKALCTLGRLYSKLGDFENAIKYDRKVLNKAEKLYGLSSLEYLGYSSYLLKDYFDYNKYKEADSLSKISVSIAKNISYNRYINHLNNRSLVLSKLGKNKESIVLLEEVLNFYKIEYGEDSSLYATACYNIGTLYQEIGDDSNAINYLKTALEIRKLNEVDIQLYIDTLRCIIYSHMRLKLNYDEYANELFDVCVKLFSKLTYFTPTQRYRYVQNFNLQDLNAIMLNCTNDAKLMYNYIIFFKEILLELESNNNSSLFYISWQDIQKQLQINDLAIEFVNYRIGFYNDNIWNYDALILKKDWLSPKRVHLFKIDLNNTSLDDLTQKLSDIWNRIIPYLSERDNVYFSPTDILYNFYPIESLLVNKEKYLKQKSWIIMSDVYNMHRLSSTRELLKEKKEVKYTKAALYGGLNYDMTDNELLSESQTYSKSASEEYFVSRGLLEDSIRGYKWDNLNNTLQEVNYISELMNKNQVTTQIYRGNKGNEESFKALSGHEYNIIHLATHGFFYPDEEAKEKDYFKPMMLNDHYRTFNEVDMSMWRSGLVMSGGNRAWKGDTIPDNVEDGILKAQEIGDLDLRGADLVVLSACNTGQGEVTGEGVFGLQRAFKMAGAQTIVMSLTPVDDQTTMAMMNKFYTNLFSGQSKHDAFYNAQRYIRSIKPDPKYWMGWIMLD